MPTYSFCIFLVYNCDFYLRKRYPISHLAKEGWFKENYGSIINFNLKEWPPNTESRRTTMVYIDAQETKI